MKDLILQVQKLQNKLENLNIAEKKAVNDFPKTAETLSINAHLQIVETIYNTLNQQFQCKDIDFISINHEASACPPEIASAFYKTLGMQAQCLKDIPEMEHYYLLSDEDVAGKRVIYVKITHNNYRNGFGLRLTLRNHRKLFNFSSITNDSLECRGGYKKEPLEFWEEGINEGEHLEILKKDLELVTGFAIAKKPLLKRLMASLNSDIEGWKKLQDFETMAHTTRATFLDAKKVVRDKVANLVKDFVSKSVGKSIGFDKTVGICAVLGDWSTRREYDVFKVDILKESPKSFRVNVHKCWHNGEKRIDYVVRENILIKKDYVYDWMAKIMYGYMNIDQIETEKRIREFKKSKSIAKIYETGSLQKLFKNKRFQKLYDSLKNLYVAREYSFITDDSETYMGKGCIWRQAHTYNATISQAIDRYNPDVALVN